MPAWNRPSTPKAPKARIVRINTRFTEEDLALLVAAQSYEMSTGKHLGYLTQGDILRLALRSKYARLLSEIRRKGQVVAGRPRKRGRVARQGE